MAMLGSSAVPLACISQPEYTSCLLGMWQHKKERFSTQEQIQHGTSLRSHKDLDYRII